jgi:hypothetical protein
VEAQAIPAELELKKIDVATKNLKQGEAEDKEFNRRLQIADLRLKQKDLAIKEKSVENQRMAASKEKETEDMLMQQLSQE